MPLGDDRADHHAGQAGHITGHTAHQARKDGDCHVVLGEVRHTESFLDFLGHLPEG